MSLSTRQGVSVPTMIRTKVPGSVYVAEACFGRLWGELCGLRPIQEALLASCTFRLWACMGVHHLWQSAWMRDKQHHPLKSSRKYDAVDGHIKGRTRHRNFPILLRRAEHASSLVNFWAQHPSVKFQQLNAMYAPRMLRNFKHKNFASCSCLMLVPSPQQTLQCVRSRSAETSFLNSFVF